MQDFATRSLKISEETPEVAMELLTEDVEVCFFFLVQICGLFSVFQVIICFAFLITLSQEKCKRVSCFRMQQMQKTCLLTMD